MGRRYEHWRGRCADIGWEGDVGTGEDVAVGILAQVSRQKERGMLWREIQLVVGKKREGRGQG